MNDVHAKCILISLLNKSVDFKHLNFIGKSFHMDAVILQKIRLQNCIYSKNMHIIRLSGSVDSERYY